MRVLVIGAGAIGGWLAGVLSHGGAEVSVLARGATLAALRSDGLTLLHGEKRETLRLPASDRAEDLPRPEAVVLAVKTNGFADAVASASAVFRARPPGRDRHERAALVVPRPASKARSISSAWRASIPAARAAAMLGSVHPVGARGACLDPRRGAGRHPHRRRRSPHPRRTRRQSHRPRPSSSPASSRRAASPARSLR